MKDSSLLHTFTIDFLSEEDGRRYSGQFTTKKLTIRDMTQLGVRKAQLCGGLHYDPLNPGQGLDFSTDQINGMLAHLEVSLTQAPAWWNLDELTDIDVLAAVHKEVVSFENNFPRRGATAEGSGPGGSGQESSPQAASQSDAPRDPQQVVGEQVQASLEP